MSELVQRVERIETDLYSTDPENPGAMMRMDRLERIMKYGAAITLGGGGLAVVWQWLQYLTAQAIQNAQR